MYTRQYLIFSLFVSVCVGLFTFSTNAQTVPEDFSDAVVVSGFNEPVGFTFDGNERLYVWEKCGKVWIVENGVRLAEPLIDISEEVGNWRDLGCLGFALDPHFLDNGRIYLLYTVDRHYLMNFGTANYSASTNEYYNATITRLTRYTAVGPSFNTVDTSSRTVLIGETRQTGIPILHESHGPGSLVFGSDGTLMISAGDAATYVTTDVGSEPVTYFVQALADSIITPKENVGALRSQLIDCMDGKLLRIDPETGDGLPSNPFYDPSAPRSPQSRVWALGLRNPYRFTLRKGTGSTDPSLGRPGVFYIGDVGWNSYEELNVCYDGGMNFGWPLFEGMEALPAYVEATTQNLDAPDPLFGQGQCEEYFNFQDLIGQESATHMPAPPNPCDTTTSIPVNIHTFTNSRPLVDWYHSYGSRCSAYDGNTAVSFALDAVGSPVPGPAFGGNSSVGGTFIAGAGWPDGYQDVYLHGDYGGSWIKRFTMDTVNKVVRVDNFASNMGAVVFLREGPDGALWYVRYETGQIRKISPIGVSDLPPVAVAYQDLQFGPAPLTVQFNGSASSDPENDPLNFLWDFGDGQTSTDADPQHTFIAPVGVPTSFIVNLTVRDLANQPDTTSLLVSVNNTPPNVSITSFPDGFLFTVGVDTLIQLEAAVEDAESSIQDLQFAWQTIFHHNTHIHPESVDHADTTSTMITGLGCYDEIYYYEQRLTVTDPGGLSTTATHFLYPNCATIAPTAVITSSVNFDTAPLVATLDGGGSVDNGDIVSYAWDFGDGTSDTGAVITRSFTEVGEQMITLTVTDNDGLIGSTIKVLNVCSLDPPQCSGDDGMAMREYWADIPGKTINSLLTAADYPATPTTITYPMSLEGPVNLADNYGTRMRGHIIPSESGTYIFNTTSDDASMLYLSVNAEPAFKQPICSVPGATAVSQLDKYSSQQSGEIELEAGAHYYFEFLQKEGTGGDHMTVRWKCPGSSSFVVIDGDHLAAWQDCPPGLKVRVLLSGPYDPVTGLMRDGLRAGGLIPAVEPYTAMGLEQVFNGGEESVSTTMLAETGKNAIVDWVLIELRDKQDPTQIVATRSALVQRDGDVVGVDGYSKLLFDLPPDNYYVAVRHRNHLGVMTASAIRLDEAGATADFTLASTATYGTAARAQMPNGRMALWSGNAVADGKLKYTGAGNDSDAMVANLIGAGPTFVITGYLQEDVNMDGVLRYTGPGNDREPILGSIGGVVHSATVTEQLP